jgi:glycosyltransferase involved in cell wall biosynthesis
MNLFLENVNLSSTSGPNHFAAKLVRYLKIKGVTFDNDQPYDKKLTFIQSYNERPDLDMFLRLDGIYFNSGFDCERMNYNIKQSYHKSKGVIFQTEFNKNLIFKWFGEHDNYRIINNGADIININSIHPNPVFVEKYRKFENIWSCASHWHSFKRLQSNIEYFLNFSGDNDCLVVCGSNPDFMLKHPRILYVGDLSINDLFGLYKMSKYFIHLAYLDHCPNVVVDARACGCKIICSSAGGTREIAGADAIVLNEPEWNFEFIEEKTPPKLNLEATTSVGEDSPLSMAKVAKQYLRFISGD